MIVAAPPLQREALSLRDEFLSLPGLTLTLPQAARLLGVREAQARKALEELEEEGFLVCSGTGVYFRPRCAW